MDFLHALNRRNDDTFLLPTLGIIDIDVFRDRDGDDGLRAIIDVLRSRSSADNASPIKRFSIRNMEVDQLAQYELEKYVPSVVIDRS